MYFCTLNYIERRYSVIPKIISSVRVTQGNSNLSSEMENSFKRTAFLKYLRQCIIVSDINLLMNKVLILY